MHPLMGAHYPVLRQFAWFSLKNFMLYERWALSPVCLVFGGLLHHASNTDGEMLIQEPMVSSSFFR